MYVRSSVCYDDGDNDNNNTGGGESLHVPIFTIGIIICFSFYFILSSDTCKPKRALHNGSFYTNKRIPVNMCACI